MTVPFAFANLSGNIALSKLDSNFNTPITIGNTSVQLGNTVTTLNNLTLANVTITSGTSNVTNVNVTSINVVNVTATLANVTTLNATSAFITTVNIATANVGNLTLLNALTVPNGGTGLVTLPVNNVLLGNGTSPVASVAPGNAGNVLTSTGSAWVSNAVPQLSNVAPNTAPYILASSNGNLTSGRVLTAGGNVTITDNGPGNTIVISAAGGGGGNGTGTVTNVSVVTAKGFSGTVANSTTNAAITISTTFDGIAWSNATGVLSNVAIGTGLSFSNTTGVLTATGAVANAVTAVTATSPISSSGGTTPDISLSGTVAVGNGGTGLATIPAGNVVIGNGTSAVYGLAPGTAGNVLTSIGGQWVSNAAVGGGGTPGGGFTTVQFNNSGAFGGTANLTFNGTTLNAASINVSTGNLTFTTTGQKFVGDFTNATVSNRTNFVTGTANSSTGIYALPSGTSTAASWQAANNSDPTNASKILIATNGSTDVQLVSGVNGTGTYLPLTFFNGGAGRFVIGTSGEWGIGPTATVSYGTAGQPFISSGASAAPVYGTLTPVGGGTGLATIPSGNVLLGNGTSAVSVVAPGTAGNVLTSIGGVWTSNAAVGGGGTPGGNNTEFQYNNGGAFAGAANLTTDGANVTIGSANTFRFANLTSTRYVGFRANAIVAANVTWTLPVTDGSANQFLQTDGTGTLGWGTAATASPILESSITISQNYTITSGSNGFSVGPVSVATGYAVTVGTGQVWLVSP
jgi:hypothetical protein